MTLTDEQRKKKNEDAKKYYAKYREQIRENTLLMNGKNIDVLLLN